MSAPTGTVELARDDAGERSSTAATRGTVAAALGAVDASAGAAAGRAKEWRKTYLDHLVALTAAGARSREDALTIARAGLDQVAQRVVLATEDSDDVPLAQALAAGGPPLGTQTVTGSGERRRTLVVPYRGEDLSGDALLRRLDAWVAAGTVEPSCREAVAAVVAHPDWLDLSDRAVAVLGAGAEMGPVEALLGWGATVLAVDVPSERVWDRLRGTAVQGAGTLVAPSSDGVDGADVLTQTASLADWLEQAAPGLPLTVGSYAYADGAAHLRLAAAADALVVHLLARRVDVGYAELATPTDAFVVPLEVVESSRARWGARGVRALLQAPARPLGLYRQQYTRTVPGPDGEVGVADSLVPQQGPNYALAKRLQRWRAVVAQADGVPVSANVAPATRTRSVTKNPVLAAAYAGAHHFGVEVFEPATSRALMAALLVHDLRAPRPAPAHPDALFVEGAAHGGFWRVPYSPRSVLTLAAAAGAPGMLLSRGR